MEKEVIGASAWGLPSPARRRLNRASPFCTEHQTIKRITRAWLPSSIA